MALNKKQKIMAFWAFFDLTVLVAGVISLVFSIIWRTSPDLVIDLTISHADLKGTLPAILPFTTSC